MQPELTNKPTPTEVAVGVVTGMIHAEQTSSFNVAEFERLCSQFSQEQKILESSKRLFEESRDALQRFVDKFGYVPSDAEKTIRCESSKYQASVIRATSIEINDSRVVDFQTVCRNARLAKLFPSIFSRHIYYTLAPGADRVIEKAKPSFRYSEAFHTVYALCFTPKPKSPSLSFVDHEEEKEKREAKAAAKLAKQNEARDAKATKKAGKGNA